MVNRATRRKVARKQFREKLAEQVIGEDWLVEVELENSEASIFLRPTCQLDAIDEDPESFGAKVKAAQTAHDLALVALGEYPEVGAEDQLTMWLGDGGTVQDLLILFRSESDALGERLGKLRLAP
ncbi:hypothetical protein [Serinibacter salmoneus]|uniref:Uncharacterized protein n=1 Tax=Serinibacter salmoneus TaxID=556530 RepID=A0A2A9D0T8_9MICO|nr:hypothetical protein [Serinibacter salmoneus]PFG19875.1 hypothetical protein ATL40_1451 [Serinibacter salmoneus]